jgi:predicted enzyme related to lactoylglutathione lyase
MKTSGITAALPAQDLGRAKAFYVEKVGLQALESDFLKARNGQVGLSVGDGVNQLFVYPAQVRSSGEFTHGVIHVTDVRAVIEEMRGRGVDFEEYDTPETRTENGIARMPGGGEAAWFKDSEGNLVGFGLWQLPPAETFEFAVEWPFDGIELTIVELDGAAIVAAAGRSAYYWPDTAYSPES